MGAASSLAPRVDCYCVAAVTIGSHVTVSQDACLCTASHDVRDLEMRLTTAPITIDDNAWVCARAFVGPGVTIGEGAVIGACAVAMKDVAPWLIVAGNPSICIGTRIVTAQR